MILLKSQQLQLYIKHRLLAWDTFTTFLAFLGGLNLVVRLIAFFYPLENSNGVWAFVCIFGFSLAFTLWRRRPLTKISYTLNQTDTKIEVCVGNIFNFKGCTIIPTNTSFDTIVNEILIASSSIQGQYQAKVGKTLLEYTMELKNKLSSESPISQRPSKVNGNKELYPYGTVVEFKDNIEMRYMLWAMAELNEHGMASTNLGRLKEALEKLWKTFNTKSTFVEEINIPLCGTKYGRSNISSLQTVFLIIGTFIKVAVENSITNKLRVVIYTKDYYEHGINMSEIDETLCLLCKSPSVLRCLSGTQQESEGERLPYPPNLSDYKTLR